MIPNELVGDWSMAGMEVAIVETASGLAVRFPEAPEGFENLLEQTSESSYLVRGGPFDGAVLELSTDDAGGMVPTVGGVVPLSRLDRPATAPPGSGLVAPEFVPTAEEEAAFASLWQSIAHRADGRTIDEEIAGPSHRFVQWLMAQDAVIFHGSNRLDIDEFQPQRTSMELNDTGGRGNLGAVYGTHDGLWSMFFAVVDRGRLRGSIRNGSMRFETTSRDRSVDMYHFSIHHEVLATAPFTTGALYLFQRDVFERLPFYPGGPMSNEWACHEPLRPLARLTVSPEDFPFLSGIGGHDDGPLLALDDLGTQVYDGVVSARRTEGGFEIVTSADATIVDRFIDLSADFYPDVTRVAEPTDDGVRVTMTGPPAFVHNLERRLEDHLER